ncbi:MAG: ATP-binding protein [Thermoplasmatota archaeon]
MEEELMDIDRSLSTLIKNFPGMAYRCRNDKGWTMKFLSEACYDLTGYSSVELVDDKIIDYNDLIHPDDREYVWNTVQKAVEKKEPFELEYRIITDDGDERWVWEQGRQTGVDEDDTGILEGIIMDITYRKKVEERREVLHSVLRHDVMNKIQVARGYLDLMKEDMKKEDYTEKVERALRKSEEIIDKVKTLNKIDKSGKEKMLLKNVFDQVISEYQEMLKDRDIDLKLSKIDEKVQAGPLLNTVFSNLIENALKHSMCDRIVLDTERKEDECIISIEDDGEGIPDDEKENVFDKGYHKGESSGSGLGLYLVNEIIRNYDGNVEVKDSELGGARFDVVLKKVIEE